MLFEVGGTRKHDRPSSRIPTFEKADRYTFPTLTSVERCRSTSNKTDHLRLGATADLFNTVKIGFEIQGNTLQQAAGYMVDTWCAQFEVFGGRTMSMNPRTLEHRERRGAKFSAFAVALTKVNLLLLLLSAFPIPSYGRGSQQEQSREPLGSLTSVGEVYLNDSLAPGEATIFPGDKVRTGETGTAAFAMSGKGTVKISPLSRVVFSGSYEFTAALEAGTIVLNTITGPKGLTLRIGNNVVVPYTRQKSATLQVTRAPDGSIHVACLDGSAGVLTMDGNVGQFLQAGQSTSISASSNFLSAPSTPEGAGSSHHPGWILLGLAGAGAAAAAALLHGGSTQSISPSGP